MYNLGKVREVKRNKRILTIAIICIVLILALIIILPNILLKYVNKDVLSTAEKSSLSSILNKNYNDNNSTDDMEENKENKKFYNLIDLVKYYTLESSENVVFNTSSNVNYVIDNEKYIVDIVLTQKDDASTYTIEYGIGENRTQETLEDTKQIQFELNEEGKNDCYIEIKKDGNILDNGKWNKDIYKINSYKKQYLDELEKKGVGVHLPGTKVENFLPIYSAIGSQYIRCDLRMSLIYKNGIINFDTYNEQVNTLLDNKVKMLAILGSPDAVILGDDKIVSSDEDLKIFNDYVEAVAKNFPKITDYEIINEPNAIYKTDENLKWYAETAKSTSDKLKDINPNINVLVGAASYGGSAVYPSQFINKISKLGTYKATDYFSYHIYDFSKKGIINNEFKNKVKENVETKNQLGGFISSSNTEYGASTYTDSVTQEEQAWKIPQQAVLSDKNNIDYAMVYNFRDSGTNVDNKEDNFGLVTTSYIPKLAYYSLKNYYQNTNGAEYIGEVSLADGLEFHVYDKDGKPKIVAWSNDTNKNIAIPYQGFTAKDIYGNDIQADETGNLTVTTSPVYLDNISRTYFYQAISKTMKEKIEEFNTKFTEEISKVNGLSENLQAQKQIAEDIGNHNETSEVAENIATQYMKDFYGIGNTLIDEYKKGTLNIEDVKLSSMLDALNDIGDSYEDLVTITAQTRNANIEETSKKIEEAENIVNNGEDLNNIYPSKILDFAKDFNEKATYINSLDEENDIKTGLIVSKNLHASLLADWAKQFADVYIDKYISENPITVTYSIPKEQLTNQDVKVTINKGDDTTITNNGGSNEWTFTTNGYYIFNYKRRGREGEIRAEVNNIDKEKPKIVNVELDKIYTETIKPLATDTNLEKVQLYNDDELIETYKNGDEISEEGLYKLIATDKVGNTQQIQFQIFKKGSTEYIIQDKYIKNISEETTVKQFREKFPIRGEYVIRRNGRQVTENNTVATGDELEFNDSKQKYTLIVTGDINKDSKITVKDLTMLQSYILEKTELDDVQKLASDANIDNKEIGVKDLVRMRIILLSN